MASLRTSRRLLRAISHDDGRAQLPYAGIAFAVTAYVICHSQLAAGITLQLSLDVTKLYCMAHGTSHDMVE